MALIRCGAGASAKNLLNVSLVQRSLAENVLDLPCEGYNTLLITVTGSYGTDTIRFYSDHDKTTSLGSASSGSPLTIDVSNKDYISYDSSSSASMVFTYVFTA